MPKTRLLCNCNRTMPLEARALARALGLGEAPPVASELCRHQLGTFEAAVKAGEEVLVACTQEAPLFGELHAELRGGGRLRFVNIRESAGWSAQAHEAGPKIAALLALAELPEPEPVPLVSYCSRGALLVIGPGRAALEWAARLAEEFSVSVLASSTEPGFELPAERRFPVFSGRPLAVRGYLGAFEVEWEQTNPIDLERCTRCNACIRACPEAAINFSYQIDLERCRAHRQCVRACGAIGAIDFERAERRRSERFDLVLDLSREPLIRLPQPPQGYFAPGADPLAQALAVADLARMVGEFEKPQYFAYRERLCAHARSEIVGCSRCIDVCSTGAIASEKEENRVRVEPHLCMGCGGCATVCPSGAMSYAYPRVADLGARLKTLLRVYREAGGRDAWLLFHDAGRGREAIARLARRGRGLPANVIPLEVFHIASIGPDVALGAIAFGAAGVAVLAAGDEPESYRAALRAQFEWAERILGALGYGENRLRLIEAPEAAELDARLWECGAEPSVPPARFDLSNDKRTSLEFAFEHLFEHAPCPLEEIALPPGAPYGRVLVDRERCTLCMACVGACPETALLDAKDAPRLQFIERNCVQCGLCERTCPEDAISLAPRLALGAQAKAAVVLNEAEPYCCVRCGKPFATRRMIESMAARLGSHAMFAGAAAQRRLHMCADCRVLDMMADPAQPSIFDYADRGGV